MENFKCELEARIYRTKARFSLIVELLFTARNPQATNISKNKIMIMETLADEEIYKSG